MSIKGVPIARGRLVADRFRRIWATVEAIAETPGLSRIELSKMFHLSERQTQSDLNIVRSDMRLPLVRRQGYRFVDEGGHGEQTMDLREAQLLIMILRQAMRDRAIPNAELGSLLAKLPATFAPHLRPLVARTIEAVTAPPSSAQRVFLAVADALLRGDWVALHEQPGSFSLPVPQPVIRPELLLPYLDGWYVVGYVAQRHRSMMLALDGVIAVSLATAPVDAEIIEREVAG